MERVDMWGRHALMKLSKTKETIMKVTIVMFLLLQMAHAQNLPPSEQERLKEENQTLRTENKLLKSELQKLKSQNATDSARMMEVLQKGKKYQEDQLKALEELDQETN